MRATKIVTANAFPYCVLNQAGDVLAVFRLSETARICCAALNKTGTWAEVGITANNIKVSHNIEVVREQA